MGQGKKTKNKKERDIKKLHKMIKDRKTFHKIKEEEKVHYKDILLFLCNQGYKNNLELELAKNVQNKKFKKNPPSPFNEVTITQLIKHFHKRSSVQKAYEFFIERRLITRFKKKPKTGKKTSSSSFSVNTNEEAFKGIVNYLSEFSKLEDFLQTPYFKIMGSYLIRKLLEKKGLYVAENIWYSGKIENEEEHHEQRELANEDAKDKHLEHHIKFTPSFIKFLADDKLDITKFKQALEKKGLTDLDIVGFLSMCLSVGDQLSGKTNEIVDYGLILRFFDYFIYGTLHDTWFSDWNGDDKEVKW